jgi:VWFA-related protein
MKTIRWTAAVLILVLMLGNTLSVGAQGAVNVSVDNLDVSQFPQAKVMTTVRDANGVPIPGLGADRFELVEDGRASFPPSTVDIQVNPDAVISVVMVIDISGSMKGKPIEEAMRAASALLDQLSLQDRAAIIAFADKVQDLDPTELEEGKEVGFTTDKNAIRNVVNFLNTKIGWDTPLYDAIYKGVKMVSTEPAGKRAVIVMTDGRDERDNAQGVPVKDTGSLSTPDDPINEANRHNIPIFSIGLVGLGGKIDTKYLQRLAERTGGLYQQAPKPEELTPLFENVVNQLKTQYVLSYESRLSKDDNYHSLMVRVTLPQGQDFDEIKFQIVPSESAPPEPAAVEPTLTSNQQGEEIASLPTSGEASLPVVQPTPEPEASGIQGIIDTIKDTIEERPMLAVVVGGGVLLLIILLIALLVVLLRGRRGEEEEYASVEFDEPYSPSPPPAWTPGPTDAGTPVMGTPSEDKTEFAPGGWSEPAAAAPPYAAAPADPEIPAAGSTRIIERAPKHLAMLVDKGQPDRKHDLKATTNIGRAPDNQLVLDEPTVSRHHAWIKAEGEEFLVFDIGSANGTFVNDEQIEEPRRLENGDVVRFGDAEFVFTKVF